MAKMGRMVVSAVRGALSMPYRQALAFIAAALNLPFGYTLSTWAAATLASHYFGPPAPLAIFAFLAGAICAYLTVAVVAAGHLKPVTPVRMRKATLLNVGAMIAAGAVSTVAPLAPSPLAGFFVAGLASTLVYMLTLSSLLWFGAWRVRHRR